MLKIEDIELLTQELWYEDNSEKQIIINQVRNILNWSLNEESLAFNVPQRLKEMKRFKTINRMLYRDSVYMHSLRLNKLLILCSSFIDFISFRNWIKFDFWYSSNYCLYHDDSEWILPFWDIPTNIKNNLSDKSKNTLEAIELKIVEILMSVWLIWLDKEWQKSLYKDVVKKTSLEAILMSYLDKIDWLMSCFHEILAWNEEAMWPFMYYINYFKKLRNSSWVLSPFFNTSRQEFEKYFEDICNDEDFRIFGFSIFDLDAIIDLENKVGELLNNWKTHTKKSIESENYWVNSYKLWKHAYLMIWYQTFMWEEYSPIDLLTKVRE